MDIFVHLGPLLRPRPVRLPQPGQRPVHLGHPRPRALTHRRPPPPRPSPPDAARFAGARFAAVFFAAVFFAGDGASTDDACAGEPSAGQPDGAVTLEEYRAQYEIPIPRFYERLMGRAPSAQEWL
ncbi:hypothetical protein ACWEO1_32020, partial [Kitasatospora cineracea]